MQFCPKLRNISKRVEMTRRKQPVRSVKNNATRKSFIKERCGPNPRRKNSVSCYTDSTLLKMKDLWNTRQSFGRINSDNPKQIWKELKENLKYVCNRESCWIKSELLNGNHVLTDKERKLVQNSFAPRAPEKWKETPRMWLSSTDISAVMKQYEYFYPDFEFIGPAPLDFDHHLYNNKCVWEDLCQFDVADQLDKNKMKIGIVLNTDYHDEPGQHWIALFINLIDKYIMFFDSTGNQAPREVKHLIRRVRKSSKQLGLPLKLYVNRTKHQSENTECGMYVMFFIIELLTGRKEPKDFMSKKFKDDEAFKLRDKYYRQE